MAAPADARFGRAAQALAPRSSSSPTGGGPDDAVDVALRTRALPERMRDALAALPRARLIPSDRLADESVLRCPRADLARLADEHPAAAILLAAHDHSVHPPAAPRLMGVINVTPDSFSDGGRFLDPGRAVEHGLRLAAEGAAILDVGGESTRPGAEPVGAEEELRRIRPVVRDLARAVSVPISIDTTKPEVARAALDLGASLVNDVAAGTREPAMLRLVAERGAGYVAMHMQGTPRDMQAGPAYRDPVAEILEFLRARVAACLEAGVELERIAIDPGIGFGKTLEHNLEILRRLPELRSLGLPVLVGVSRKSFLARLTGRAGERDRPDERSIATAAAVTACVLGGAEILRVHDVARMSEAVRVASALTAWRAEPARAGEPGVARPAAEMERRP